MATQDVAVEIADEYRYRAYPYARLGVARRDGVKQPQDPIACLCEVMSGLIVGVAMSYLARYQSRAAA